MLIVYLAFCLSFYDLATSDYMFAANFSSLVIYASVAVLPCFIDIHLSSSFGIDNFTRFYDVLRWFLALSAHYLVQQ